MILGLDCETTGLPDWGKPSDAEHQPHVVQIAMVLLEDDLTEIASTSLIIKPDGWEIPQAMTDIHGISHAFALAVGVPEKVATDLYVSLLYGTGAKVVGHNVSFDLRIMRIALLRAGYDKAWQESRPVDSYCTMGASTSIVNLPPTAKMLAAGFNKPKAPKLSECVRHFFDEDLEGAHDALVDVRACLRVYRHLMTPTPIDVPEDVL